MWLVLECVIKVHECGWFLSALLRFLSALLRFMDVVGLSGYENSQVWL